MLAKANVLKPDEFPYLNIEFNKVDVATLESLDIQKLSSELKIPIKLDLDDSQSYKNLQVKISL